MSIDLLKIFLNAQIKEQRLLNELLVYGEKENESYVVAFERHVFIIKDENKKESIDDIISKLYPTWPDNPIKKDVFFLAHEYMKVSLDITLKKMQSLIKDIFIGKLLENSNTMYVLNFGDFDGEHSPYIQQILQTLKIKHVITGGYIGSEGVKFITNDEIKKLPDTGFHGTSSKYLTSILKFGIETDKPSNWKNIQHVKYIFFSTKSIRSLFHAQRISKFQNSTPIIIEFRIPNKDHITQDFDIEKYTGVNQIYTKVKSDIPKKAISNKPMSLSKNLGIYAYIGDILPQYIKAVWIPKHKADHYFEDDFIRLQPKEAIKQLGLFQP